MNLGYGQRKPEVFRVVDLKRDIELLDKLLMMDLLTAAEQGNIHLAYKHIQKIYFAELASLILTHQLQSRQNDLIKDAAVNFANSVGAAISRFPDKQQQPIEDYDKWCQGNPEVKGGISYYFRYYVYDTVTKGMSAGAASTYTPKLAMDDFKSELQKAKEIKETKELEAEVEALMKAESQPEPKTTRPKK